MDRRTFLKASGAAAAVAAMPAIPAFGADGPKPWRDLVEWCKSLPNIQGYLTGAWTPEYTIGDHGSTWVGMADSLVIAPAFSPEEACASMKEVITEYISAGPEAIWWRMLPSLRAFWYIEESAVSKASDQWIDRVALLERPHYTIWCRIAAFGANRDIPALRKEGWEMPDDRADVVKARCGVVDTIHYGSREGDAPLPLKHWSANPPSGAKMFQSASSVVP